MQIQPSTPSAIDLVRSVESAMMTMPQVDVHIEHHLHAGVYTRTAYIPAGVTISGAEIVIDTVLIINGNITIHTGDTSITVDGFRVIDASAGRKTLFTAHTDSTLTMVFATSVKTVEAAEDEFTTESARLQTRARG